MKIAYYPGECPTPPDGSVVTIGAFDGVHLGHRRLIERVRSTAAEIGAVSVVVTFDKHPASVVRPGSAPLLLTDLDQKLALLEASGVDMVLVVHFDASRAAEPAEAFVDEVLVGCLNARARGCWPRLPLRSQQGRRCGAPPTHRGAEGFRCDRDPAGQLRGARLGRPPGPESSGRSPQRGSAA